MNDEIIKEFESFLSSISSEDLEDSVKKYDSECENGEFKAASAMLGFPCIYYIGCRSESMEYQFIQYCPLCGEKLV